jgi:CRISPR-associated endonuclease/helicase Cas3
MGDEDFKLEIDNEFNAFYRAINGYMPYEYQRRLVRQVAKEGKWPDLLDGPTGSGKSVVIEAHVFLNAYAGEMGIPKSIPRRLAVAVNRRSLVDSQFLHAQEVASMLREALRRGSPDDAGTASDAALVRAAQRLRERWGETGKLAADELGPLLVTSMRGGVDASHPDTSWRMYPEAPMVICATPDMVGSRLLFRGYGVSRNMRPVEAGLLANDCVLAIDESHLNRQFVKTARRISELENSVEDGNCIDGRSDGEDDHLCPVARPLQVVEMTATPIDRGGADGELVSVNVSDDDVESDEELARRVCRPKRIGVVSMNSDKKSYPDDMVSLALSVSKERGGVTALIVNSVILAASIEKRLRKRLSETSDGENEAPVVCVLGRMRPYDRSKAVDALSRLSDGTDRCGFIIGTQALEVGLNYDCRSMITELCPVSALIQRLGRLNRFGREEDGRVTVVDCDASVGPYRQEDLQVARDWINDLVAQNPDGVSALDLSRLKIPAESGRRILFQRLETADVAYLSHTSELLGTEEGTQTIEGDSADLALWLRDELGEGSEGHDVYLAVRKGLPSDPVFASDLLSRIPVLDDEMFPCSFSTMRSVIDSCWQTNEGKSSKSSRRSNTGSVASSDLTRRFMLLASEDGRLFHELRPGDRLVPGGVYVVDDQAPLFIGSIVAPRGFSDAPERAADCHDDIALGEGVGKIPFVVTDDMISRFCDMDGTPAKEAIRLADSLRADIAGLANDPDAEETVDELLDRYARLSEESLHRDCLAVKILSNIEAVTRPDAEAVSPKDVTLIFRPDINGEEVARQEIGCVREVNLDEHQRGVCKASSSIAQAVGLPRQYIDVLTYAGSHHDDGKADPRFQRMLAGGRKPTHVLAKGKERSRSEVIRLYRSLGISGWRHEQLSAAMAWADLSEAAGEQTGLDPNAHLTSQRELAVRLVGTSHGRGRSAFDWGTDDLFAAVDSDEKLRRSIEELFGTGLWESIVSSTDREFGYWGTAYLESIVRAADARESAREQGGE